MRRRADKAMPMLPARSPVRSAGVRWLIVLGIAVAATSAAAAAPRYMRGLDNFRVQRVEVVGTRFMPPDQALAASGITERSSVFDDPAAWRERLLRHALVHDVRIERNLPGTIRIVVRESEPVALVPTPELRPVDARGRILPIDLSSAPMDLPLLALITGTASDGTIRSNGTRQLLRELGRIQDLHPMLAARISELEPLAGAYRIVLREPAGAEVLLPMNANAQRLREVESALSDLAARSELNGSSRIDGRFSEQVVVAVDVGVLQDPVVPQPAAAMLASGIE
jgi:cell division septal protein FtsQ